MSSDASAAEIREAYRRRARLNHPDRSPSSSGEMAAINEAYRVLSDPGRRVVYDGDVTGPSATATSPTSTSPMTAGQRSTAEPLSPARMPWKLMATAAAIGSALVLVGAAFVDPPSEEAPDGILRNGSCVEIEANGDAREISCTGVGDVVVELLIPIDARCPPDTEAHRDRLGLGTACIAS